MIEFSLSKLNLLVFVTAIAAIVLFFMNTVNSNLQTRQSFELVYKIGKQIKSGVESSSYCTVKHLELPRKIQTNTGSSSSNNLSYVLNISNYNNNGVNKLILSIMDTRQKKIYAAYDVDYNGVIYLYSSEFDSGRYIYTESSSENNNPAQATYSPLKESSNDTRLIFAKKIKDGVSNIYIFPCAKKNGVFSCTGMLSEPYDLIKDKLIEEHNVGCIGMVPELYVE